MRNLRVLVAVILLLPVAHLTKASGLSSTESEAPQVGNSPQQPPAQAQPVSDLVALASGDIGRSGTATTLPDQFTGSMTVNIGLTTPAGRHGLRPSLNLLYRSGVGSTWMGVGWDLDIGTIERSARSGVNFDDDRFLYRADGGAIDLVRVGDNTYRAKIEGAFRRFRKIGGADGVWELTDATGSRQVFGSTPASRVFDPNNPAHIFKWCLDRVEDIHGNFMKFSYVTDGGQPYLTQIDYNGGDGLAPSTHVSFELEDRFDLSNTFVGGFRIDRNKRLKTIDVFAGPSRIRRYELGYVVSAPSGRSLLKTVTEVSADLLQRLPAISFEYDQRDTWRTIPGGGGPAPAIPVGSQCLGGDFNGDGHTNLACYTGQGGNWHVVKLTGTGWQSLPGGGGPAPGIPVGGQCLTGDFNGNGRIDIACYTGQGGNWHVVMLTGTGWQSLPGGGGPAPGIPVGGQCLTGDFNGNGRTDIACYTGQGGNWHVVTLTPGGWQTLAGGGGPAPAVPVGNQCLTGDFNGDGRTDMACYTGQGGNWHVVTLTPAGWQTLAGGGGPAPAVPVGNQCSTGDFNGDGRTDMACYTGQGGNWHVVTLTAGGWQTLAGGGGPAPAVPVGNQCLTGDFNGDGRTDMTCYTGQAGNWHVVTLTSGGWRSLSGANGPAPGVPVPNQCLPGDYLGQGRTSIACYTGQAGNWHIVDLSTIASDLLTGVRDTLGGLATIAYQSSSAFHNRLLPFSLPTVSMVTTDSGNGHPSEKRLIYEGGYYSIPDHDFRGFAHVRVTDGPSTDPKSQRIEDTDFHQGNDVAVDQNDPTVTVGYMKGKPYRQRVSDGAGTIYSEVTTSYRAGAAIAPFFNPPAEINGFNCDSGQCSQHVQSRYEYDAYGNVIKEEQLGDLSTPTDDRTISRTYETRADQWLLGLLKEETVSSGVPATKVVARTVYAYDEASTCSGMPGTANAGNMTRLTAWSDATHFVTTAMGYDKYGNLICKTDSRGSTSSFEYDSSATLLRKVINALKQTSETTYYGIDGQGVEHGSYGLVRSRVDPSGSRTLLEYDSFGRLARQENGDGSWVRWSYADDGNPVSQRVVALSTAGLSSTSFYDGAGRVYLSKTSGPKQTTIALRTEYDARGFKTRASRPFFEGVELAAFSTFTYDAVGRVVETLSPDGIATRSCFSGWASVFIDGNGHQSRRVRDALGRLVLSEEFEGTHPGVCSAGPPSGPSQLPPYTSTSYKFDVMGNLTEVRDTLGHVIQATYDMLGHRLELLDPDLGKVTSQYDENGNLTLLAKASGRKTFYRYDRLNRLLQEDHKHQKPLGKGDVIYEYDGPTTFGAGRVYKIHTSSLGKTFYYDAIGRVERVDRRINGRALTLKWSYDGSDRLAAVTYSNGDVIRYAYDGPFLARVYDQAQVFVSYQGFSATGKPSEAKYGNGVSSRYIYGTSGDPGCKVHDEHLCRSETFSKAGQPLSRLSYEYDAAGNITWIGNGTGGRIFLYDALDRLIAEGRSNVVTMPGVSADTSAYSASPKKAFEILAATSPLVKWTSGFGYDRLGNMIWNSKVGDYNYGDGSTRPHAVTKAGKNVYTYDPDGNMLSGGGRRLTYRADGALSGVVRGSATTEITTDEAGHRVQVTSPGHMILYNGDLEQCTASTCVQSLIAGDRLIATRHGRSGTLYYHEDHQYSTTLVTNQAGKVVATLAYASFGQQIAGDARRIDSSRRFTGQQFDQSTGLYFYGSRYYDPVLSRFVQPDTLVPYPTNGQSLNRYSYVLNNPVTLTDPDGHCPICIAIIIGAAIGGTSAAINHQNVLEGIARGAILGAITGGAATLTEGSLLATQVAIQSAAGATASATNAMIFGGDVGKAAAFGALFGAGSAYLGRFGIEAFDSSGSGFGSAAAGVGNELLTAAAHGAVVGATYAAISGGNIIEGAGQGAEDWAVGELQNMGIGHAFGFVASGFGAPRWEKGAFKYDVAWMKEGTAFGGWITFGNVISGSDTGLDSGMYSANSCPTYRDHEMGHVRQSTVYGRYYPIAAGMSLVTGAGWALARTPFTTENILEGAHRHGLLERWDNPAPVKDYQ